MLTPAFCDTITDKAGKIFTFLWETFGVLLPIIGAVLLARLVGM